MSWMSRLICYAPLISNGVGGSDTSIKNISDSILETRDIVNVILAEYTGKSIEEINDATNFDNYMNAGEAIEFGICDEITANVRLEVEVGGRVNRNPKLTNSIWKGRDGNGSKYNDLRTGPVLQLGLL